MLTPLRLTFSEKDVVSEVKQQGFRRIRWLAVLLPTLSVGLFEFLRHEWLAPMLPGWLATGWLGNLAGASVVATVVYAFVRFFTDILRKSALEATRAREEAAVIVERQRIAREMHDSIAQTLFYLAVKLREVDDLVAAGEGEEARGELRTARGEIEAAYHQVRTVIADLKQQAELEDFGGALRRVSAELAERLGVRVVCEVDSNPALRTSAQKHLLAIIQEALTNAQRHGRAQSATVRVKNSDEGVTVEVSDDGAGFDPSAVPREGRYGLNIMKERALMVGGQLHLTSAPGHGTRVTVNLPGVTS